MARHIAHAIFVLFLLAGCSTLKGLMPADKAAAAPSPDTDPANTKLAAAADRASTALRTLSELENRRAPPPHEAAVDLKALPAAVTQPVTLAWIGPLAPIVKIMADQAGYSFRETGQKSGVPILVRVDAKALPLVEVLRDVGLQSTTRATIRVNCATQEIELRYASPAS